MVVGVAPDPGRGARGFPPSKAHETHRLSRDNSAPAVQHFRGNTGVLRFRILRRQITVRAERAGEGDLGDDM